MTSDEIPTTGRRVAVVTGGNHGIGAATAIALAAAGVDVLVDVPAPRRSARRAAATASTPPPGRSDADEVLASIDPLPGRGAAIEVDLRDDDAPARIFDAAEQQLGPVSILVNNASGWVADTFDPQAATLPLVSAPSVARNLGVDARAGALLIAELARRHVARARIVGPHRRR